MGLGPIKEGKGKGPAAGPGAPPSDPGPGAEALHFHYSRARRLERASPMVKWLNEDTGRKGGFLSALRGSKSLAFLLAGVLVAALAYAILGFFVVDFSAAEVGGFRFSLSAFSFDGEAYATLAWESLEGGAAASPAGAAAGPAFAGPREFAGIFSLDEGPLGEPSLFVADTAAGKARFVFELPPGKEEGQLVAALRDLGYTKLDPDDKGGTATLSIMLRPEGK